MRGWPAAGERGDADVDLNPVDTVLDSLRGMAQSVFDVGPQIVVALIVLAIFVVVGRVVRDRLEPRLARLRTTSFGRVFSSLAYAGVVIVGLIVAIPIALPSVSVGGMLAGLGIVGVAAGFAFQDILSNLLAGVLLILRQPFTAGDQVTVGGISGTVEVITIRETRIRGYDGRLYVVPNADVYTNPIEVQTDRPSVRHSLVVGVEYDADLQQAEDVALDALAGVDGILADPPPQAYYTGFGASAIDLDLRFWTGSQEGDIRRLQGEAVKAVKAAYDEAGIDIPFDIVTLDTLPSFDRAVAPLAGR